MRSILKIFGYILCIAAVAVMAVMAVQRHNHNVRRAVYISKLESEARPYEVELNQIRRELNIMEGQEPETSGAGGAVVAYGISDPDQMEMIESQARQYGFDPAIVLNLQSKNLNTLTYALYETGYDIILTYSTFDDEVPELIDQFRKTVSQYDFSDINAFLLRENDDTPEHREMLTEAGITRIVYYSDNVDSGPVDGEYVQLNYSYINKSGYSPKNRLRALDSSEQAVVFVFHMPSLQNGDITEKQMQEVLDSILQKVRERAVIFTNLEEAEELVRERAQTVDAQIKEFHQRQEELTARAAELQETIDGIYSHWDEGEAP